MIVDDEPLAIQVIETHLSKVSDMVVCATCTSALEAYEHLHQHAIDLIFLDIEMPELTGIDFLRSIEHRPAVIFTTAYREFALEGFELDVVDYLLKPISLPRLLRALDKYRRLQPEPPLDLTRPDAEPSFLTVRSDRKMRRIPLQDIEYIESLSDYVQIHTDREVIVSKERISGLADQLYEEGFIRIHRSFLVPASKITSFSAEEVCINEKSLPVSRSYRNQVKEYLSKGEGR